MKIVVTLIIGLREHDCLKQRIAEWVKTPESLTGNVREKPILVGSYSNSAMFIHHSFTL